MEIVLFIGIPGSGKSSFYQQRFAATHVRINRDMLRTAHREQSLFAWCLEHEQSCVLDNTHTTRATREPLLRAARERGHKVKGYFFQSRLQECLERNRAREGAARIPDVGVKDHARRLELPALEEGFATLHFVHIGVDGFVIEPWKTSP